MAQRPTGAAARWRRSPWWMRAVLGTGGAWVVLSSVVSWVLLPRLAADPTSASQVIPADWVVRVTGSTGVVIGALVVLLRDRPGAHRSLGKLHVADRSQAIVKAREAGLGREVGGRRGSRAG